MPTIRILMIEESDSDAWKGSVQTRHTQMRYSSLYRKNYCQESSYDYHPDDSRFSCLKGQKKKRPTGAGRDSNQPRM